MKKTIVVLLAAVLAAASVANATEIQWAGETWETAPIAGYNSGALTTVVGTQMHQKPTDGTTAKTGWLNYGTGYEYKLGLAKLVLAPGEAVTSVHAKVYDGAASGKHGWNVILKDETGKMLDFGARATLPTALNPRVGGLIARVWNGTAWSLNSTNIYGRNRAGNDYYTLDFTQNPNGTINIAIDAWMGGGTATYSYNVENTTLAFGKITEVYLATNTTDTSTLTYKWTEFTAVPEPATMILLGLGGLFLRRRTR